MTTTDDTLTVGPISLSGLELPDQILLQGKQRVAIHRMGSGNLLIDTLGEDVQIASFHGSFFGSEAPSRAALLGSLRCLSTPIPLSWGPLSLSVILKSINLTYKSSISISFSLDLYVLQTPYSSSTGSGLVSSQTDLEQISDIIALLANTPISISASQSSSLASLASVNYDIAPASDLVIASNFLGQIEDEITRLEPMALNSITGGQGSMATRYQTFVINFGSAALLTLAGNRTAEVIALSQEINT